MNARIDISGQRFGMLVAIEFLQYHQGKRSVWRCACDCGGERFTDAARLRAGIAKSCCGNPVKASHRMTKTRTYRVWSSMLSRIRNPTEKERKNYTDRGIDVCERWLSFENFYEDMGEAPAGMSIDRLDNNKGYHPWNCSWRTAIQQNNNRRTTLFLIFNGEQKPCGDWSRELGIPVGVIHGRKKGNWSDQRTLQTPYQPRKKREVE